MTNPTIAELEAAIVSGKHVDLKPDGTATISDKKPRPTIKQLLADEDERPPGMRGVENVSTFPQQLKALINYHSMEQFSDTPDWILAGYLESCLELFGKTMVAREKYYGRAINTKDGSNKP